MFLDILFPMSGSFFLEFPAMLDGSSPNLWGLGGSDDYSFVSFDIGFITDSYNKCFKHQEIYGRIL